MPLKGLKSALLNGDGILSDMDMSKLPATPQWVTDEINRRLHEHEVKMEKEGMKARKD